MPTHYEVLGIPRGASEEEIRRAYRTLVKAAHPDVAGDPAQFRLITQAYDVLTDPAQRADYDRRLVPEWILAPEPAPAPPPPPLRRRRRYGRYVAVVVAGLAVAGVVSLVVATTRQSVGDDCLVGTWRSEAFDVPFRAVFDGREIAAPIRGGAGVTLTVLADGRIRVDYATAAPLAGADGPYRIEGIYEGTSIERWEADGKLVRTRTDPSGVRFLATINDRPLEPLAVGVLDGEYPYSCTPATLELGSYRYTRT
ncbi:MAG TPA: J domain-containing protein [Acidimicrobiales bacterium]|nr:J domain-containing protein [Acidimicrobiales bacterium]